MDYWNEKPCRECGTIIRRADGCSTEKWVRIQRCSDECKDIALAREYADYMSLDKIKARAQQLWEEADRIEKNDYSDSAWYYSKLLELAMAAVEDIDFLISKGGGGGGEG